MARRAQNPTTFQQANYDLQDFISQGPGVPQVDLLLKIAGLENAAQSTVVTKEHKMGYVADHIRKRILSLADVEVVPPLSDEQLSEFANKVSFYGTLLEQATPATRAPRRATPTQAITTDAAKQ